MSLIVAINFPDKLVLLEDGRELPITRFLTKNDAELESHRGAYKFQVEMPHSGNPPTYLEVDMHALDITRKSDDQ